MHHALRLAARGLGNTWPNPAVGAVVVKDGVVVGRGWTARGGRPHAETIALTEAGRDAQDAILYVTLEPCAHHGKTPPCTEAIIRAGIKRVVSACSDPNPLVAGKGYTQLRAAGIEVIEEVYEAEALRLNEGFFSVMKRKRPFVTLKVATSLDGKIATAKGESKWITGEASRKRGHYFRATHDAIITGIGTVDLDNPELTCRLPGRLADSPQRVVVDSQLKISPKSKIFPAWIFTSKKDPKSKKALAEKGARVFTVPRIGKNLALDAILTTLAEEGITRLMVESGYGLTSAFIEQQLADRIYWFRAPLIVGEKGLSAIRGKDVSLAKVPHYRLCDVQQIGKDLLEIYESDKG